jgi:serine/threonine-protein kinase RsbT
MTSQTEIMQVHNMMDVARARRRGLEMACNLGFELPDATKIAVVISELGRNITLYTSGGTITIVTEDGPKKGIKIIAQDRGPGIPDVKSALTDGYSTSGGLGLGLSGSKRLVDEFDIWSVVNVGTTVTAIKWLR